MKIVIISSIFITGCVESPLVPERGTENIATYQPQNFSVSSNTNMQTGQRLALVIGNGAYNAMPNALQPLVNPPNDATDIANILPQFGFKVTLLTDAILNTMDDAIYKFSRQINSGDVVLLFYAGHGMQVNGENYLLPVDAKFERENQIERHAIKASTVLDDLNRATTRLIFLDACRNNPFLARNMRAVGNAGRVRSGLAKLPAPDGTLLVYSTDPDNVAEDGTGRNSPFTQGLLKFIGSPGVDVQLMLREVRKEVKKNTNERQTPWDSSSLEDQFYFAPPQQEQRLQNLLAQQQDAEATLAEIKRQQQEAERKRQEDDAAAQRAREDAERIWKDAEQQNLETTEKAKLAAEAKRKEEERLSEIKRQPHDAVQNRREAEIIKFGPDYTRQIKAGDSYWFGSDSLKIEISNQLSSSEECRVKVVEKNTLNQTEETRQKGETLNLEFTNNYKSNYARLSLTCLEDGSLGLNYVFSMSVSGKAVAGKHFEPLYSKNNITSFTLKPNHISQGIIINKRGDIVLFIGWYKDKDLIEYALIEYDNKKYSLYPNITYQFGTPNSIDYFQLSVEKNGEINALFILN